MAAALNIGVVGYVTGLLAGNHQIATPAMTSTNPYGYNAPTSCTVGDTTFTIPSTATVCGVVVPASLGSTTSIVLKKTTAQNGMDLTVINAWAFWTPNTTNQTSFIITVAGAAITLQIVIE